MSYLDTIRGIYNEDFTFFDTIRVQVFDGVFGFWYHLNPYTMQEPSYLHKIVLVSIWFRTVPIKVITQVYKDSLTLTYPPDINNGLILKNWYPLTDSTIPLWMLVIDTHAFTSIPVQNWNHTCTLQQQNFCESLTWRIGVSACKLPQKLATTIGDTRVVTYFSRPSSMDIVEAFHNCTLFHSCKQLDGNPNLLLDNLLSGFDRRVPKPWWSGFMRVTMCLSLSKWVINEF